jgi:hypothetical protein
MRFVTAAAAVLYSAALLAQENSAIKGTGKDSTEVGDLIRKGAVHVRTRSMYMGTVNEGVLKDDHTFAQGIGLGVSSGTFKGLKAGISAYVIYNVISTPLELPDSVTGMFNRYETGMYNIEDLSQKHDMLRIEDLYLRYSRTTFSITLGRMVLHTPFMNPQDGRMNVSMEEGLHYQNRYKKVSCAAGWFWRMSPRSTLTWYEVAHSLGLYPSGVNEEGRPSDYFRNISSPGVALANIVCDVSEQFKITAWDMLVANVMNSTVLELNARQRKALTFYEGLMIIHQDAVNNGGNIDQQKTYIRKNAQSNAVSAQAGVIRNNMNLSLNYTHITGDGRYLAPREWGRDPFYTFMFREKNDGFGNVHAATIRAVYTGAAGKLRTGLGYGYFSLPDVRNFRLNKYGIPSYTHITADCSYMPKGILEGLHLRFVYAMKLNAGNTYFNPRYVYNKVNMANISLYVEYRI